MNEDWSFRKTNSSISPCILYRIILDCKIPFIDGVDVDRTEEFIQKINPRITYNGTALQSWWGVNGLPRCVTDELYKNFKKNVHLRLPNNNCRGLL
jgi:hypothetical protein